MRYFAVVTSKIFTDEGATGLGYTYTVGKTGGAAVKMMPDTDLVPFLIGKDPTRIEQIWDQMWWRLHYVGRGGMASFAMAAVDIACWDLKAKLAGEPLLRYLGGHDNRVKVYAGGIDLKMPAVQLQEQTKRNLERGFRAIKMKVGNESLSLDMQRIASVREVIGSDMPLMVDANMGYSREGAIRAARAFAGFDLYRFEEPIIPD